MFLEYVTKGGKKLRCGYTTGSCVTAASKACALMLLSQQMQSTVQIVTPSGVTLDLQPLNATFTEDTATCAIKKDGGDDPDITNGALIYATVSKIATGIKIDGGEGVGRVTKAGLDQPVGNAAINSVPRSTITSALQQVAAQTGYTGGFSVVISIPDGVELAKKTYNSRLGIIGGLSILGTSGIVEPMSEAALVDTTHAQINVQYSEGKRILLLTPGNYGRDFISQNYDVDLPIKCSNYMGDAIDYAYEKGFKSVLIIGHAGKIIKLAGGLFNTHSKFGDCRAEIISTYSALFGAKPTDIAEILDSVSVDQMLKPVYKLGIQQQVLGKIMDKIYFNTQARVFNNMQVETIMFTDTLGILGKTSGADALLEQLSQI